MSIELNQIYIARVRPLCGSKLKSEPGVFDAGLLACDGIYLYLGTRRGDNMQCLHCGVTFVRQQPLALAAKRIGDCQNRVRKSLDELVVDVHVPYQIRIRHCP